MAGPWDKYADDSAAATDTGKPWEKYGAEPIKERPQRSFGSELGRQAGLTGRYVAEGLAGIADPINELLSLPTKAMGMGSPFGSPSEAVSRRLTQAGVPEPETPGERAVGTGSRIVAGAAMPMGVVKEAGPAIEASRTIPDLLKSGARRLMQSALKPPIAAQRTGKAAAAVDTLLDEGVNVSKGGVAKLQERIGTLNEQLAKRIEGSPATIDKEAVASRLQGLVEKFTNQVTPSSDVRAIQNAWDDFMAHPLLKGDKIPVKTAQSMKQGTYKALGDKAYGELKGAETEAQKALARGLKEEIAKAVPEVRQLNAQESRLINGLSLVERRVLMEANKNPAGLGWLTLNPAKFAGYMADRSGLFKSLIARMLNAGSRVQAPATRGLTPSLGYGMGTNAANQVGPMPAAPPATGAGITAAANQVQPPPQ